MTSPGWRTLEAALRVDVIAPDTSAGSTVACRLLRPRRPRPRCRPMQHKLQSSAMHLRAWIVHDARIDREDGRERPYVCAVMLVNPSGAHQYGATSIVQRRM